jgi:hypothetical protein
MIAIFRIKLAEFCELLNIIDNYNNVSHYGERKDIVCQCDIKLVTP